MDLLPPDLQHTHIHLDLLNRESDDNSNASVSHEQINEIYSVLRTRLLLIGGISSSAGIGFTVAGSTASGVDSNIAFNAAWACFGFTLGCLTVIKTCRIFLKTLNQMHGLLHSLKKSEETVKQSPSSVSRPLPFLDERCCTPPANTLVSVWQLDQPLYLRSAFSAPSLLGALSERPSLYLVPRRENPTLGSSVDSNHKKYTGEDLQSTS